jgi:hypothetical protein
MFFLGGVEGEVQGLLLVRGWDRKTFQWFIVIPEKVVLHIIAKT